MDRRRRTAAPKNTVEARIEVSAIIKANCEDDKTAIVYCHHIKGPSLHRENRREDYEKGALKDMHIGGSY
jgi:hypothetical protein